MATAENSNLVKPYGSLGLPEIAIPFRGRAPDIGADPR